MRKFFLASVMAALSQLAFAQSSAEADRFTQDTINAAQKTTAIIMKKIRPNVPPSYQKLLDPSKVKVGAYGDFYAYFDPKTREIHMPFGIWHGFRLISWAYQDLYDDPSLLPTIRPYMKFVASQMREIKPKSEAVLLPDIRSWAGLPKRKPLTPVEEELRAGAEVDYLVEAMAFVLIHELAHLYHGHKVSVDISPAESKDQESLADVHAKRILVKSGFDVLPAAQAMLILGMVKLDSAGQLIQVSTHPHPFCRVYRTFLVPLNKERNSPRLIEAVRRMGMPSVDFYIGELLSMKEAC